MLQKDCVIKSVLKRSDNGKKADGIMCLFLCYWSTLNLTWGFSFFLSSLIDWTDWWSAPWSSQERKHWTPQGTQLELRDVSHYSGQISCVHIHPLLLFVQERYHCVCLCVYGLLPAWLQGVSQSINPHTVHQKPRWLPSASCQYSLQLFSILTPRAGGSAMSAADTGRLSKEAK